MTGNLKLKIGLLIYKMRILTSKKGILTSKWYLKHQNLNFNIKLENLNSKFEF